MVTHQHLLLKFPSPALSHKPYDPGTPSASCLSARASKSPQRKQYLEPLLDSRQYVYSKQEKKKDNYIILCVYVYVYVYMYMYMYL